MAEWRCGLLRSPAARMTPSLLQVSEFELTPNERYFLRVRADQGLAAAALNAAHQFDYDLTYTFHVTRGIELMSSLQYLTSS